MCASRAGKLPFGDETARLLDGRSRSRASRCRRASADVGYAQDPRLRVVRGRVVGAPFVCVPDTVTDTARRSDRDIATAAGSRSAVAWQSAAVAHEFEFDLAVVGSGPAGQKAAIQAAKLRRRVVADRAPACARRQLASTSARSRRRRSARRSSTSPACTSAASTAQDYRLKDEISIEDLSARDAPRRRARARGRPRPAAPQPRRPRRRHCALRRPAHAGDRRRAGTRAAADGRDDRPRAGIVPARPPEIAFNGRTILDSDDIVLRLARIPQTLIVVGAGVIGVEFASMFAALGTRVTARRRAAADARLRRCRDRRGAALPPARPQRDLPLRRGRDGRRRSRRARR